MGKRFIYFAALLFCTACTSDSYYAQQARIYKEITQMVETASTIEEVDSLNKELSYALLTLDMECRDEKVAVEQHTAKDEELYKEELEELLRVQREFVDAIDKKRNNLINDKKGRL